MKPIKDDKEMIQALLDGKELVSVYGTGSLKIIDGNMTFINKRWQYINPKDWMIKTDEPNIK